MINYIINQLLLNIVKIRYMHTDYARSVLDRVDAPSEDLI